MIKLKNNIGFDLGASKLRLFQDGKLINEVVPSVEINSKVHDKLILNGRISDFYATDHVIRREIKKIQKPFLGVFNKPFTALVSIPSDFNDVSIRSFRDVMEHAGAKTSYMVCDCFVSATGLGLDIANSTSMIVDAGASKTSITTMKGFEIVSNNISEVSGGSLNEAIKFFLSHNYALYVDLNTCEMLKKDFVNFDKSSDRKIKISGKVKHSDTIKEITIPSNEITNCLSAEIDMLVEQINRHYIALPFEMQEEIKISGIHFIGDARKLNGLLDLISKKFPISNKSYCFEVDYMRIGLEKIQINPSELYHHMVK